MSRYRPAVPATPTSIITSDSIPIHTAHSLLQSYLLSTTSSQPWSHSHDAGTTASLKKLDLSLRGIHGPSANAHFLASQEGLDGLDASVPVNNEDDERVGGGGDDVLSKPDTDEGGEAERQRVYETIEDLEGEEEGEGENGTETGGMVLKELVSVKKVEEGQADVEMLEEKEEVEQRVDKEERKRLKKLRLKEEKRRKEAERAALRE